MAVASKLKVEDEWQETIFGIGFGGRIGSPNRRLRVCDDSRPAEHAMLRLDAVLAREQDPGLLQNDELRARA